MLYFSIAPGRAPSNITFSEVTATQFRVTWNTLPQRFHNGRLLGYRVDFAGEWSSYDLYFNTNSSPNVTWALITGLRPAQKYVVHVAAFTSKGEGPFSSGYYVTTGKILWQLINFDVNSVLFRNTSCIHQERVKGEKKKKQN